MQKSRLGKGWARLWMRFSGRSVLGRAATFLATWGVPPFYGRRWLAQISEAGYVSPSATLHHDALRLGAHVFIGDRVLIYQDRDGGSVELESGALLIGDTVVQTGSGGSVRIGERACVQPRCQFSAYIEAIDIGARVQIAPNCGFYSYDHGMAPDRPVVEQPLQSKGPIIIGDDAWLGFGVVVLSGVSIGSGAVIAAGSVVTRDIPDNCIAAGTPARIVRHRSAAGAAVSRATTAREFESIEAPQTVPS